MDASSEVGRLGPRPPDPAEAERQVQAIVDAVRDRGRVRAKFRLNSYTTEMHTSPGRKPDGSNDWQNTTPVEKRTLNFTPVADSSLENRSFWDATPSGSLQLGVVNPEAWEQFEIGEEYYLDFVRAPRTMS